MGAQVSLGYLETATVVIAAAGTTTPEIPTSGMSLVGVMIPSAFTGTAITFQMTEVSGGSYIPVKSGTTGAALSYTVAPGQYNAIDPKDFQGIQFLKIVSGSTEGVARNLVISLKGL